MKKIIKMALISAICLLITNSAYSAKKAPRFSLVNNKGRFVFSSKMKGNLIISFWASYCNPCKKEMPKLIEFEKKYGKTKDLKLVIINVDKNDDKNSPNARSAKEKAEEFLKEINVMKDYLLDIYQITIKKYNPKIKVPATYLIDKNRNIIFHDVGFHNDTMQRLEKAIKKLR